MVLRMRFSSSSILLPRYCTHTHPSTHFGAHATLALRQQRAVLRICSSILRVLVPWNQPPGIAHGYLSHMHRSTCENAWARPHTKEHAAAGPMSAWLRKLKTVMSDIVDGVSATAACHGALPVHNARPQLESDRAAPWSETHWITQFSARRDAPMTSPPQA
jgi:hypothetical protein